MFIDTCLLDVHMLWRSATWTQGCFAPAELGLDWEVFGYKRSAPTELRLVLLSGRRKRGVSAVD